MPLDGYPTILPLWAWSRTALATSARLATNSTNTTNKIGPAYVGPQAIESQIAEYNIDEEAKATFREALDAHGYGLHRSVCRVLFPEIERMLRTELFGRRTGRENYQKIVETLVEDKTLDDFLPGGRFDFDYFGHLTAAVMEHSDDAFDERIFGLFRRVDEDDLQRVGQDPVPNRHAAMHGYVSYSSSQNSLNAIFVADYMFRLIGSFRNAQTARE